MNVLKLSGLCFLFAFHPALADTYSWTGASDMFFNNPANWLIYPDGYAEVPMNPPGPNDQTGATNFAGEIVANGANVLSFGINNAVTGGTAILDLEGGGLTLGNGFGAAGGTVNVVGTGTLNITGGEISLGDVNTPTVVNFDVGVNIASGAVEAGTETTGTFNLGAGNTWNVSQLNAGGMQLNIQGGGTVQTSGITTLATLNVQGGGSQLQTGSLEVGVSQQPGALNISNGGMVTTNMTRTLEGAFAPVSAVVYSAIVDGAGSQFINNGGLDVQTSITLTNGALVNDTGGPNGSGATSGSIIVQSGSTFYTGNFSGTAAIDGGSTVVSGVLSLYPNVGPPGSSVSGAGTTWTAASGSIAGSLDITQGGVMSVTNSTASLALSGDQVDGASTAVVLVQGTGSALQVAGNLLVGYYGNSTTEGYGILTVQDGGSLQVGQDLRVGAGTSPSLGNGQLILDGSESNLQVTNGTIYAGYSGTGVITAQNGFTYSDIGRTLVVGAMADSNGTLNVVGPDTSLTLETVTVGRDALSFGTLNVNTGGSLTTTQDLVLASQGSGTATIDGQMTTLHVGGNLTIGDAGVGQMTVQNSAQVSVDSGITLGSQATGNGTLTVTGADTVLNGGTGETLIGDAGRGTLTISAGGTFDAPFSAMTIANQANAVAGANPSGTVTVTGQDSALNVQSLTVGSGGNGTLLVNQGGSVTVSQDLTLGGLAGGIGTATITDAGSSLSVQGNLIVGSAGKATLSVQGADISVGGQQITVGQMGGGNGVLTINLSKLDFDGTLTAGQSGKGVVTFGQGTTATMDAITLGVNPGSSGTVNVNDPGTVIQSNDLTVGAQGKGTLNVTNGGRLNTLTDANIANAIAGFTSTANVNTGAVWAVNGDLDVGSKGSAALNVLTAGQVVVLGSVKIGDETSAGGTVLVSVVQGNMPSTLTYGRQLIIGNNGGGVLNIQSGGLVGPEPNGPGTVSIAAAAGSNGSLNVDGQGSLLEAVTLAVGGTLAEQGGNGSITLTNGGAVEVASDLVIWTGNTVDVSGGSLTVGSSGNLAADGTLQVNGGGTLSGGGTIVGQVINDGGTVAPGDPMSLLITGSYLQTSGNLDLLIDGDSAGQYDELVVNGGTADFLGGSVILDFSGGYAPVAGETFDLIMASQGVSAPSDLFEIAGLSSGFEYSLDYDASSGLLQLDALNNGVSASPTPEPATFWLIGIALAGAIIKWYASRNRFRLGRASAG